MLSFRPAFHMARCLPPLSGGDQPAARRRRMSSRHLIGFGIVSFVQVNAINSRQLIAMSQTDHDPTFQSTIQIFPALLKRRPFSPATLAIGNLAKEAAV